MKSGENVPCGILDAIPFKKIRVKDNKMFIVLIAQKKA
ncbi:hypothetical protein PCC21_033030 [Pectobacterium carotovorum subsp. carotovorum PCC21]|nr:hypothetical protein PCC21_033030 [Pectobacterium carotovorum subsp. carotovorum PCC21]